VCVFVILVEKEMMGGDKLARLDARLLKPYYASYKYFSGVFYLFVCFVYFSGAVRFFRYAALVESKFYPQCDHRSDVGARSKSNTHSNPTLVGVE
jgi:hypothetical protein